MNRRYWAVMGAVIVMSSLSVGLVFLNPQAVQGQEAAGWLALDSELQRMEPYVRVRSSGDFPVQTLDADAALTNGFSREALALAQEMLDLQNDMSRLLFRQGGADITQLDIDLRDYPKVKAFLDDVSAKPFTPSRGAVGGATGDPDGGHPCGNFRYPLPHGRPLIYRYEGDAESFFRDNGFHRTLRWMTAQNGNVDFTRGRSYHSVYGTCRSPIFRDHGWYHPKTPNVYRIQRGEPNPELHTYAPPYWRWWTYVQWWHDRF